MIRNRRLFVLTSLFFAVSAFFYYTILFDFLHKKSLIIPQDRSYRGCIATLIQTDSILSINKLLNLLNSLKIYFKNIHRYPIYLFHEPTLTNETREQILHCSSPLNIQFYEIHFNVTIPSNRSGYASMCQFWSYDIWFKYDLVRKQCDYVMRFDDDSYLTNSTKYDLFEEFHKQKADYGYRIIYKDNNGLDFLRENLRSFIPINHSRHGCVQSVCTPLNGPYGYDGLAIYNNFFVIRLNLMYEHPIIEQYLEQLVLLKAFFHYRIGDANIQTICLLLIEKPIKLIYLQFSYNHNVHGAGSTYPAFHFHINTAFMWYFKLRLPNVTCHTLFIATKHTLIEKSLEEK